MFLSKSKFIKEQEAGGLLSSLGIKKPLKKFKEIGDSRYIHQKELDKASFQDDMAYGDFKDLTRRTACDKILCDNPKYDGYQHGLLQWSINFFDKKASGSGIKNENFLNKELAEELHKPIIEHLIKEKYTHLL